MPDQNPRILEICYNSAPMKKVLPALTFSILFMTGCATVEPIIQEFNIVSIPQEVQMGQKFQQEIAQQMRIVTDPRPNARVQSLGRTLVAALPRQDFHYQFYGEAEATPNAFTIPGGSIYVHTGLLDFAPDDSELAGVLAHEIGHAYARHPAKALSRMYGVEQLSNLIFSGDAQGKFRALALQVTQFGVLTRYSRADERQADDIAYVLLRRARMRTDGLLRFLRKLQSVHQGREPLAFLSTHPPTPERIARLEQLERAQYAAPQGF